MGKINGCLKCLFIFFNVLFAMLGCILSYGTLQARAYSSQLSDTGSPNTGWGWVFAIGILSISCLGIYAGVTEKELALKIFAGFMVIGMIIMLIFGIIVAVFRNKFKYALESGPSETVKPYLEIHEIRTTLDSFQTLHECCGVVDARDWGDDIPLSCRCGSRGYGGYGGYGGFGKHSEYSSGCTAKPQGLGGPDLVYSKTCGPIIFEYVEIYFKITLGLFFGFAVTALLGLLVSVFMIYQVKRHSGAAGASFAMKGY